MDVYAQASDEKVWYARWDTVSCYLRILRLDSQFVPELRLDQVVHNRFP